MLLSEACKMKRFLALEMHACQPRRLQITDSFTIGQFCVAHIILSAWPEAYHNEELFHRGIRI